MNILEVPLLYPALQHSTLDWEFQTEPSDKYCLAMEDGICGWPRGKVLGGSSTINAMMYVRGNRKDYDRWASIGNPGWNYDAILPYFKKSEDMRVPGYGGNPYHGTGGYLTVEYFRMVSPLADMFLEAGREMGLLNPENDINGRTQFGFARTHGTLRDGLRCSTNKAFLRRAVHRPNLHVVLNTFVEKILINPHTKRTYGVRVSHRDTIMEYLVSKEVILSAGTIQSPQVLMLSGVGPTIELMQHGIDVIVDHPGVGENLQDHIASGGATYLIENSISHETLSFLIPKLLNLDTAREFVFNHGGPLYAMPSAEVMAFINSKYQNPIDDWPDIQIFFAAYTDSSDGGVFSKRGSGISWDYYAHVYEPILYKDAMMIIPLLMRPRSRGRILLNSKNPYDHPVIFPNYFEDPHDLDVLVSNFTTTNVTSNFFSFEFFCLLLFYLLCL